MDLKIVRNPNEIERFHETWTPKNQYSDEDAENRHTDYVRVDSKGRVSMGSRERKHVRFDDPSAEDRGRIFSRESNQEGRSPSMVLDEHPDEEGGLRRTISFRRRKNPNLGTNVKLHGALMLAGEPSLRRERSTLTPLGRDIDEDSLEDEILQEKMYRQNLKRHLNQVAKDNYKLLGFSSSPREIRSSIPSREPKKELTPQRASTENDPLKVSKIGVSKPTLTNLDDMLQMRSNVKKVTYGSKEILTKSLSNTPVSKQKITPAQTKIVDR